MQWTLKRTPPDGTTQWSTRRLGTQLKVSHMWWTGVAKLGKPAADATGTTTGEQKAATRAYEPQRAAVRWRKDGDRHRPQDR